jgi:FkbM family methyltransferase
MKDMQKTVLEAINHIISQHPQLAPVVESLAADAQKKSAADANFLLALHRGLLAKSRSQLRQDLFVLHELNYKRGGYFVEFGATNGLDLSNTWLLEQEYGWQGILAEPARLWQADLAANRRRARIETKCVWKTTGASLEFNQAKAPELSTINQFSSCDVHAQARDGGDTYSVETISLMDLLEKHGAPREIDYLSIDTEGSELEILQAFDFDKYRIHIVTCEHNYSPLREQLHALFTKSGYTRKYEQVSQFDDWYVKT